MALTSGDIAARVDLIERLKSEMGKLDERFEHQLKALGLTEKELKNLNIAKLSPELKRIKKQNELAARKAGDERLREAKAKSSQDKTTPMPATTRRGAISA
ncbi:MAG: hypothetical protein LBE31_07805 [Deltaproteobacteria bacterium]|jgi:septal ring factor EnvC (AmiA/AmiB activator)|nr:hypothetical protein [Deltaproteobacteria bacterium]